MRIVILIVLLAEFLVGCTSPKFNKELVCEVKGEWGQSLQFITFATYTFPELGRFGGGQRHSAGVYFDGGVYFWRSKWLMDRYALGTVGFKQQVAKQGCLQSVIQGDIVVWLPYSTPSGPHLSKIAVSEGVWSPFHRYEIPSREGPPYLTDSDGNLLTLLNWRPAGASFTEEVLQIREETPLSKVFFNEKGLMTREFGIYVDWQEQPCEGCDPVLWRNVVSTDLGKTWKVSDWGVIDETRLPAEAELPLKGRAYYYDVELKKTLPLPPNTKLSLGIKYMYLGYFSRKNKKMSTLMCPEKGQPVSREKGTMICSDPRSIDNEFVKREGSKPEWRTQDVSK